MYKWVLPYFITFGISLMSANDFSLRQYVWLGDVCTYRWLCCQQLCILRDLLSSYNVLYIISLLNLCWFPTVRFIFSFEPEISYCWPISCLVDTSIEQLRALKCIFFFCILWILRFSVSDMVEPCSFTNIPYTCPFCPSTFVDVRRYGIKFDCSPHWKEETTFIYLYSLTTAEVVVHGICIFSCLLWRLNFWR